MKNKFDLYSDHAEFEIANKALEDAWGQTIGMTAKETMYHMRKVQDMYQHVGAGDTEPREIINEMISKRFNIHIPVTTWDWEEIEDLKKRGF